MAKFVQLRDNQVYRWNVDQLLDRYGGDVYDDVRKRLADPKTFFGYQEFWIIRNLKTLRMATFPHPQCLRA